MEGFSSDGVLERTCPLTLFLVGRTGSGKSATGNSILGPDAFESRRSFSRVTVSELRKSVLVDGRILNVIDTRGMLDTSVDSEFIAKEFVSCIEKGMDGIHAILVVLSVCCRFSEEEKAVISSLLTLFGSDIYNYMIIVFTGGDELENDGKTFNDFLSDCPEALKEIVSICEDRCVLFDNRTSDPTKKANQVQQLLLLVDIVLKKNGGQPYTNELFSEAKKRTMELQQQTEKFQDLNVNKELTEQEVSLLQEKMPDEHFKQIVVKLSKLEHLLEEERSARVKAEETAKAEQKKSDEEIEKLREVLERVNHTEMQEKQKEERKLKQGKKEKRIPRMRRLSAIVRDEEEKLKQNKEEERKQSVTSQGSIQNPTDQTTAQDQPLDLSQDPTDETTAKDQPPDHNQVPIQDPTDQTTSQNQPLDQSEVPIQDPPNQTTAQDHPLDQNPRTSRPARIKRIPVRYLH